jgi:hypothetical protein
MPHAECDLNTRPNRSLGQRVGILERHPADGWLRLQVDSTCIVRPIDQCATFVGTVDGVCRLVILALVLFALFLKLSVGV